jgi:hypothetical protein
VYVYAPRFAFPTPRLADLMEQIPQTYCPEDRGNKFRRTFRTYVPNTCTRRYVRRLSDYAVHIWTTKIFSHKVQSTNAAGMKFNPNPRPVVPQVKHARELYAARSYQIFRLRDAVIHGAIGLSSPHVDRLMT